MKQAFDRWSSPMGELLVRVDERGALVSLLFLRGEDELEKLLGQARARGAELERDPARCAHVVAQLAEYFAGERREFDLELAPEGTDFQRAAWRELARVPYGKTATYGELARKLGRPNASRAVGRANATNPIAIVLPCHRVVGADGSLTGYAYGVEMKRELLELEARVLEGRAPRAPRAPSTAARTSEERLRTTPSAEWALRRAPG